MKKVIRIFTVLLLTVWSLDVAAFSCRVTETGQTMESGSADVRVNLDPVIGVGHNQIVDLSSSISCKNDSLGTILDYINLTSGTAFGGALTAFKGSVSWVENTYNLPLNGNSSVYIVKHWDFRGLPLRMYLTATGAAGGIVIRANDKIAQLNMYKIADDGNPKNFTWNIYANNDVVIPTGGCDVSARDVTVTLPEYPASAAIPLTVHCAQNQNLSFYLSGNHVVNDSIFRNTASASPAQGVGIQLTRNGSVVPAESQVSLGNVGPSAVSLGLTANYAQINDEQVTAGNVQSIIGVTFVYQ